MWHFSLGHPSHAKLSLLNNVVPDVHINKTQCCDVYHFYKQKRLSFASSLHVLNFLFSSFIVIYGGPSPPLPLKVLGYFLLLWMIFQNVLGFTYWKSKVETSGLIQQFSAMVETQFDSKIRCIRRDNGTKFIMKDF